MSVTARFARRFRYLALLEASLLVGAAYDLGFAALMVAAPGLPARLLHLPLPGQAFYLWILATLLAMLAALYVLAARDPRRYSGVVAVAVAGRIAGALAFFAAALTGGGLSGLYPLAAADLGLGLSHALFWLPIRR
ncbi:MAG TPA: hypothetical protein VOA87_18010 [Thermoanaerobaculia bacterium]|nr:hypothetical protein [Thermoanaerobaculia bacterium]